MYKEHLKLCESYLQQSSLTKIVFCVFCCFLTLFVCTITIHCRNYFVKEWEGNITHVLLLDNIISYYVLVNVDKFNPHPKTVLPGKTIPLPLCNDTWINSLDAFVTSIPPRTPMVIKYALLPFLWLEACISRISCSLQLYIT